MSKESDFTEEIVPNTEGRLISSCIAENPHGGLIFGYTCEIETTDEKAKQNNGKRYRLAIITLNYVSGAFTSPQYIYQSDYKLDNVIFHLNQLGNLMLFINEIQSENVSRIYMFTSSNYAKSWDPKIELLEDNEGWLIHKRISVVLPDTLILPLYHPKLNRSMMVLSTDYFKTISFSNCIEPDCDDDDDFDNLEEEDHIPKEGNIKPVPFQFQPNGVMAYLISRNDQRLLVADSADFGLTWTETMQTSMQITTEEYDILAIYDQYKDTSIPQMGLLAVVENFKDEYSVGLYRATSFPDQWSTYKYFDKGSKKKIISPYLIETINKEIHICYIVGDHELKHTYFKKMIL